MSIRITLKEAIIILWRECDLQDKMAGHASQDTAGARRMQEEEQKDEREKYGPPYRPINVCDMPWVTGATSACTYMM